ncbi:DUF3857 domain-containing protein [Tenacibaculum sp. 190524A05c]|uniref:Transglutaminase-like cysteine protease n=1 Tax=Tenacibaculum platacis TaxID=3137852 RepID=A0ABM9P2Z1_9FLAO
MRKLFIMLTLLASISVASQEIKFGKVSKQALEEEYYPLDSTANAAYLLKQRKTFYEYNRNTGFRIVSYFHYRLKVYNKQGLDRATFNIYYASKSGSTEKISSVKGYTFNLDENGEITKDKLSDKSIFKERQSEYRSVKKVTMPNVKEGSIIDLKYKLTSPYIYIVDDLSFQTNIPIKKLHIEIETPEWFVFNKIGKGFYTIPPKSSKKTRDLNFNVDVYDAENIPALRDNEPFVSNINNYYGGLKYELSYTQFPNSTIKTYSDSWENVSKQIYKSSKFGGELERTSYFKEDLQNILAQAKGDVQKALAIFEHVKNKVQWNSGYGKYTRDGTKEAYKKGTGNVAEINLILTAMLREAGLGANPVLVSTRNHNIPIFPTLDGFNYVVSLVEFTDGTSMLLDATEKYAMPNVLPYRALNWNGRKVTKEGYSTWVNLNAPKHSSETNTLKVKLDEEGTVEGLLRTKDEMLSAMLGRKRYNQYEDDEVISKLEEKYDIEIENFRASNKENVYKSYNKMLKFSSEDLVENINGKLLINPLLFLTDKTNPFKSEERTFPVDFASAWKETNNVSIQLPEGYKAESIPEQFAIGLPDNLGFFKFKVTNTGKTVNINSIIQINSPIIAPNYYSSLKEFYTKVVAKQKEQIVLVKG